MEKLYTHVSYIFLYFFFSSLLTTLLLENVLSRLASKNKQNIPPSSQTKSSRERLIAGYIYFHVTWRSFKYSTYLFCTFAYRVTKTLQHISIFKSFKWWIKVTAFKSQSNELIPLPLQTRLTSYGQCFMSRFKKFWWKSLASDLKVKHCFREQKRQILFMYSFCKLRRKNSVIQYNSLNSVEE